MNALVCMQAKKRRLHAVPSCGSDRLKLHFREGPVADISPGPLRTWPLLIVILRISSTHFLQRVRVKIETFSQVAEFFPYKIRKKSMQKGKAAGDLVDLVNL